MKEAVERLSFFSQNAIGFICMNQLFILMFKRFLPQGATTVVTGKLMTFFAVMVVISWITQIIKGSNVKWILGGK